MICYRRTKTASMMMEYRVSIVIAGIKARVSQIRYSKGLPAKAPGHKTTPVIKALDSAQTGPSASLGISCAGAQKHQSSEIVAPGARRFL
jgi:hypothetical protein